MCTSEFLHTSEFIWRFSSEKCMFFYINIVSFLILNCWYLYDGWKYLQDEEVVVVVVLFDTLFTELMVKDVDVVDVCEEEVDESKTSVIWLSVDKSLKFGSLGLISLIKIISSESLDAMMKPQLL